MVICHKSMLLGMPLHMKHTLPCLISLVDVHHAPLIKCLFVLKRTVSAEFYRSVRKVNDYLDYKYVCKRMMQEDETSVVLCQSHLHRFTHILFRSRPTDRFSCFRVGFLSLRLLESCWHGLQIRSVDRCSNSHCYWHLFEGLAKKCMLKSLLLPPFLQVTK